MSLPETATKIATRLHTMDYVDVYSHHDADGIAAAAILCIALTRSHINFRLRFLPLLKLEDIERPEISILCDMGSSLPDIPELTIIIDHHVPYAKNPYHINPHLEGINGETELSAAGCAYLVAVALNNDNRDLAGLVMPGIIGDNQNVSGMNLKIIDEAIENNLISSGKGILLPGRTTREQIEISSLPYLPGLSGNANLAEKIEMMCQNMTSDEQYATVLLSEIIARSSASYDALMGIYGNGWTLHRETVQDAHSLTAVLDACGKSGHADLGFAVACGDVSRSEEAWNVTAAFRKHIIENASTAKEVAPHVYEVSSIDTISDIADLMSQSEKKPVIVLGKTSEFLKVSARAPAGYDIDFEQFMKSSAETFCGTGGGHKTRAGARLPGTCYNEFLKTIPEFS